MAYIFYGDRCISSLVYKELAQEEWTEGDFGIQRDGDFLRALG